MTNAGRVLSHLSEAARLLSYAKNNPEFSKIIEDLVERAKLDTNADMIGSMLYAARESVEMSCTCDAGGSAGCPRHDTLNKDRR